MSVSDQNTINTANDTSEKSIPLLQARSTPKVTIKNSQSPLLPLTFTLTQTQTNTKEISLPELIKNSISTNPAALKSKPIVITESPKFETSHSTFIHKSTIYGNGHGNLYSTQKKENQKETYTVVKPKKSYTNFTSDMAICIGILTILFIFFFYILK